MASPILDDDGGLAVVRIKPLGAGGGGGEASAVDGTAAAAAFVDDGVCVGGICGSRRRFFSYPRHVIAPEQDQEQLYSMFMPQRIDAFLGGINVNIMAYGQTGSGKTHTMFGPPGLMAQAADCMLDGDACDDYGLCPRGTLDIISRLQHLREQGPMLYELTASAVELTMTQGNLDMFDKSRRPACPARWGQFSGAAGVSCDKTTKPARLYGMTEVILDGDDSIRSLFQAIACRNTAGTGLNDSSSRSHCFVFLTLYAFDPSTGHVRISRFQFVDLAGSERLRQAHGISYTASNMGAIEGICTNYSLMILSQRVRELVAARRRGKKAEALVEQSFKTQLDPDLLPLLGESLTGSAMSLVVVCVSSAPANTSQSINALDFGEGFSHLTVVPKEMPGTPLEDLRRTAEKLVSSGRLSGGGGGKYAMLRAAQARDGSQRLKLLAKFECA